MNNKQMEMMAREYDMSGIDPEFVEEVAEAVAKGTVSGYKKMLRVRKKKYAQEIIERSEKIMEGK